MNPSLSVTAATQEAYTHWAPTYPPVAHNPLMRVEQQFMLESWPEVSGRCTLDLAAGSGRYSRLLASHGAADVVALDFCAPMLRQVTDARQVCGSMMQLPFANDCFDVVVSGLALGHATNIDAWMREMARVLKRGGTVLYSDFHPQAAQVNLTRTFTDVRARSWTVPHHSYTVPEQIQAAHGAGFTLEVIREIRVGIELKEPFKGSEPFYAQWHGLPIVLIVRASR